MKFFKNATAALFGSAVMLSAVPASAQISSIGTLLDQVRQDSAKTEQENREREAKFRQRRDTQSSTLSAAQSELASVSYTHLTLPTTPYV